MELCIVRPTAHSFAETCFRQFRRRVGQGRQQEHLPALAYAQRVAVGRERQEARSAFQGDPLLSRGDLPEFDRPARAAGQSLPIGREGQGRYDFCLPAEGGARRPLSTSQSARCPSVPPTARVLPSGEKVTARVQS